VDLVVARRARPRPGLVRLHEVLDRSGVTTVEVDTDHAGIVARPAVDRIVAHLARVAG
jgi:hypothetical protein